MNRFLARLPLLALLFVVLMTIAFFVFTHEGLYALDDYFYSRYAHQLLTGTFRVAPDPQGLLHDPLKERPLIFGPVAGLYKLLGINIISTTLWPLLATLGCAGLLYALYRRRAPVVASAAMLLLGLHYFTLDLARYLYPDNILLLWCLASAAALLRGRQAARRAGAWGAGFALLNFAALLSKETIVYYLPFYLLVLGRDLRRRQHQRFWAAALPTGVGLLAAYGVYYQVVAQDALFPLHVVEYVNEKLKYRSYISRHDVLARVTWQPLALLVGTGLAPALLLALVGAVRWRELPSEGRFWLVLAGTAGLFYWVGSTSLTYYNPNSLFPRMLTPILPPLMLAAGFGVEWLVRTNRAYGWVGAGLLLSAAWLHNSVGIVYALLGGFFLLMASPLLRKCQLDTVATRRTMTVLALGLTTAIRPLYFMQKPSVSDFAAQQRLLHRELRGPAGGVVFADDFLGAYYPFSYGFSVPQGLQFLPFASYDTARARAGKPLWLLLNRRTLLNPELRLPYSAAQVLAQFPKKRLVARQGEVELYAVEEAPSPAGN